MPDAAHVRHLAQLARLSLSDAEVEALSAEAERILELFDTLPPAADDDEPERTEHAGRPDEPRAEDPATVALILGQVPRKDGRTILVPRGGEGA